MPDFSLEDCYSGLVCGIDEVGRGPLAGPVVAACVFIPEEARHMDFMNKVQDSKKISKARLCDLSADIHAHCAVSLAEHSPAEIDTLNILNASLSAMAQSYSQLSSQMRFECALVDGNRLPSDLKMIGRAVVKGDMLSKSIAAASIVAKVYRDRLMDSLHADYPQYSWNSNAGYPTPAHKNAILQFGITSHHRKTFAPVRNYLERKTTPKAQKTS